MQIINFCRCGDWKAICKPNPRKKRSKPFGHQSLYAKKILENEKTLTPDLQKEEFGKTA